MYDWIIDQNITLLRSTNRKMYTLDVCFVVVVIVVLGRKSIETNISYVNKRRTVSREAEDNLKHAETIAKRKRTRKPVIRARLRNKSSDR